MEISVTARDAAKVPTLSFTSEDLIARPAFHIVPIRDAKGNLNSTDTNLAPNN